MGKPIAYSTRVDIPGSANTVQWFAEAIDKIYDEVAPHAGQRRRHDHPRAGRASWPPSCRGTSRC